MTTIMITKWQQYSTVRYGTCTLLYCSDVWRLIVGVNFFSGIYLLMFLSAVFLSLRDTVEGVRVDQGSLLFMTLVQYGVNCRKGKMKLFPHYARRSFRQQRSSILNFTVLQSSIYLFKSLFSINNIIIRTCTGRRYGICKHSSTYIINKLSNVLLFSWPKNWGL